jgi:hypothetical protein
MPFSITLSFILFLTMMSSISGFVHQSSAFKTFGKSTLQRSAVQQLRSRAFNLQMSNSVHLVLVRHGESTWNEENKFTGWYDCPLSKKGEQEAIAAGKLLKENNFKFDIAYTSYLQRAIKTLWHGLEQTNQMYIPIRNRWQLNER